jgi:aldehyde dehydrogenase (NAD+)
LKVAGIFESLEYGPAPESAAPAEEWLDGHGRRFGLFIDGEWRVPDDGDYFDSINPANARPLAAIAQASAADVDAAVKAARRALDGWRGLGPHGRARYLYALARQLQKHSREFAVLESLDNGKPIRESRDIDIPLVIRHFYHHAGWAQLMDTELVGYEPVGVVGQIIPWNFPLLMLAWKVAPALAMGNTVVLKPAEFTSLTALRFAELCAAIGLPKGVVNIVTGDGRTGEAIVHHEDIDKIAFTGSTDVGRIIRTATAGTGRKLSLELGGKSPFIVFDDADLDSVVEGVVDAIWFNQGQVCCAGSRILVHEGTAQRLIDKLRARMERLRVGDPLDKAVDIGAIIAPVQLERIDALVRQGVEEGAAMWQPSWSCPQDGYFFPPTLFTDVAPAATIAQVEIFGPVVVLMTFRTHAEAVELANNTRYGLAASVWTENINLALDVAPKLKAGTVWINSTNVFDAAAGFGGYRESGFGREGGREGLYEYVQPAWQRAAKRPRSGDGAGSKAKHDGRAATALPEAAAKSGAAARSGKVPPIDRTAKLYIGGRQVRPDSGYSLPVHDRRGHVIAEVGRGNRKDVRNAVEAAHASAWSKQTAHNRAQVLYYLAENLAARSDELAQRLRHFTAKDADAEREVALTVERLFFYAAYADKW